MKNFLKNPLNIVYLIFASALFGGTIIYGITETFNEEKTYLPVKYDRFVYFPWYSGKGLTPDPTIEKEALMAK